MIEVTSVIKVYELNGKETAPGATANLTVMSHWNRREFVVLVLPDGSKLSITAKDMKAALENATNSARW